MEHPIPFSSSKDLHHASIPYFQAISAYLLQKQQRVNYIPNVL
jgi:hypothetical protein